LVLQQLQEGVRMGERLGKIARKARALLEMM
jgi:hypothetical protein